MTGATRTNFLLSLVMVCQPVITASNCYLTVPTGIWDCLSSQQVVNFVRYQVSEGKSLAAIGEMMCEHCLAPDTTSGAGIG